MKASPSAALRAGPWLVLLLALTGCGLLFPLDDVKETPSASGNQGAGASSGSGDNSGSGGRAGSGADGGDPGLGGSPACAGVFDNSTFDQSCFQ